MEKYKNVIMITIAILLFIYAAFISIVPAASTKSFNKEKFIQKFEPATGLIVDFDNLDIKIKPNFTTVITVEDLNVQYPDKQPLLKAKSAELYTTPAAIFSHTVLIKNLYLQKVQYDDMVLPSGENKIAFFPSVFNPEYLGAKNLTIIAGPVSLKGLDISYTVCEPYKYTTEYQREAIYSQEEVRNFLTSLNFKNVKIK